MFRSGTTALAKELSLSWHRRITAGGSDAIRRSCRRVDDARGTIVWEESRIVFRLRDLEKDRELCVQRLRWLSACIVESVQTDNSEWMLALRSASEQLLKSNRLARRKMSFNKNHKGFSLIELLIVVAIILIIAAIAIPNLLRARIAANEASAVGSVRTIVTTNTQFYTTYGQGFAPALTNLGGATPCTAAYASACLIDPILTNGSKSGYT